MFFELGPLSSPRASAVGPEPSLVASSALATCFVLLLQRARWCSAQSTCAKNRSRRGGWFSQTSIRGPHANFPELINSACASACAHGRGVGGVGVQISKRGQPVAKRRRGHSRLKSVNRGFQESLLLGSIRSISHTGRKFCNVQPLL